MGEFVRVWQEYQLDKICANLLVIGELSGECFSCHKLGIKIGSKLCPSCGKEFKFIAFRRHIDSRGLRRFKEIYPTAVFVEFEDISRGIKKQRAKDLFD